MTVLPEDPAARPLVTPTGPQSGHLTLYLETAGLGCSGVRLPARDAGPPRMPFRLGPLECEAVVDASPDVSYGLRDGMTSTSWSVRLVGVPASFTVADLLEAVGAAVTR